MGRVVGGSHDDVRHCTAGTEGRPRKRERTSVHRRCVARLGQSRRRMVRGASRRSLMHPVDAVNIRIPRRSETDVTQFLQSVWFADGEKPAWASDLRRPRLLPSSIHLMNSHDILNNVIVCACRRRYKAIVASPVRHLCRCRRTTVISGLWEGR